jgi:hypothetical protein
LPISGYSPQYTKDLNPWPSESLWDSCKGNWLELATNPGKGTWIWESFPAFNTYTVGDVAPVGAVWRVGGTGVLGTCEGIPDGSGGGVRLNPGSTAENEIILTQAVGSAFNVLSIDGMDTWYETRLRINDVSNSAGQFFAGLSEWKADTDNLIIGGAATLAVNDYIGFAKLGGAGSNLLFVYCRGGQTVQTFLTLPAYLKVTTWFKVGFRLLYGEAPSRRLAIFVDGVEQVTHVTHAQLKAATFPNLVLTPTFHARDRGTGQRELDVNWLRAYQAKLAA